LNFAGGFGISPAHEHLADPIRRHDPFDEPAYLFELKYDGFRAVVDTLNNRTL